MLTPAPDGRKRNDSLLMAGGETVDKHGAFLHTCPKDLTRVDLRLTICD